MENLSKARWREHVHVDSSPLNPDYLQQLKNGELSLIVLKGLLSAEKLQYIQQRIMELHERIEKKDYVNGSLSTFGPYLAKHLNSLDDYFSLANATDDVFNKLDLRQEVRTYLCDLLSISSLTVAQEKNGKTYAPAIVRVHADGVSNPLHNDNIMRDTAHMDLILNKLLTQLSCIVCIQECDRGGELRHYAKKWSKEDEVYKIPDGLGYRSEVVNNIESISFRPETGDIYLINPTYYHAIAKVAGKDRITLGFFIGFFEEEMKNGVVWS